MKKKMKEFQVKTTTCSGGYIFLTKGKDGKEALNNLIKHSRDYNNLLKSKESNGMSIKISLLK